MIIDMTINNGYGNTKKRYRTYTYTHLMPILMV